MTRVFISYAREDKAFVRQLHEALTARSFDPWVDWEDIPPTAEFMREVFEAIEASDSVVLVLSPDWAKSAFCLREATHALAQEKRLIPILLRELAPDSIEASVAALNWIVVDPASFGDAFKAVETAIVSNLPRAKSLTRLLVRARDWELHGRESSYLLRGADLEQAEQLLADTREPEPALLHREYVLASRVDATTRLRRTIVTLTCGLVLAIASAAAALWQYRVAETNREQEQVARIESERQQRIATAQHLAALADVNLDRLPQRSLLLAVESLRVSLRAKEPIVADGERSLRDVLASLSGYAFGGPEMPVSSVSVSKNSRWAALSVRNAIYLWDLERFELVPPVAAGALPTVIDATAFAENDEVLVAVSEGRPYAWRLHDGSLKEASSEILALTVQVDSTRFCARKRCLVGRTVDGRLVLWSLASTTALGRPIYLPRDEHGDWGQFGDPVWQPVLANDGRWLAWGESSSTIVYFDLAGAEEARRMTLAHSDPAYPLTMTSDSRWLIACSIWETLRAWKLTVTPEPPRRVFPSISTCGRLIQSDNEEHLLFPGYDSISVLAGTRLRASLILPETEREREIEGAAISNDGQWVLASRDGGSLAAAENFIEVPDDQLLLWNIDGKSVKAFELGYQAGVQALGFTGDAQWAYAANDTGRLSIWPLAYAAPGGRLELRGHQGGIEEVVATPDGRWLLSLGEDASVRLWTLTGAQSSATPVRLASSPGVDHANDTELTVSPYGDRLVIQGSTMDPTVWALDSWTPSRSAVSLKPDGIDGHLFFVSAQFSSDNRWLAVRSVGTQPAPDRLFDLRSSSPSVVRNLGEPAAPADIIAFSRDSRWLGIVRGGEVLLLSLADSHPPSNPFLLTRHTQPVTCVDFSPAGGLVATGSKGGEVRLFAVGAPEKPIEIRGHRAALVGCQFGPDAKWLVTASQDGVVLATRIHHDGKVVSVRLPGHELQPEEGTHDRIRLTFSPDGRWLVTSSWRSQRPHLLWTLASDKPETTGRYLGQDKATDQVWITADSRWAITTGRVPETHTSTRLWPLTPGAENTSFLLTGHLAGSGTPVMSQDGRWLATAGIDEDGASDKTIRLWNLAQADPTRSPTTLDGHERNIDAMAFSPDSEWLVSGAADAIRAWQVRETDTLRTGRIIRRPSSAIKQLFVSSSNRFIVAHETNGAVHTDLLQVSDILELAKRTVGRNFTEAEWRLLFRDQPYRAIFSDLPFPPAAKSASTSR